MKVSVLRLGHRKARDMRMTTHVGLTGRALGANRMVLSGERDDHVLSSLRKVVENWGGDFEAVYEKNWQRSIEHFKGLKVHLTMYGLPIKGVIDDIRARAARDDLLVVVGSEKVPGRVYGLVDYNVSVTSQPHSEVSSLAIFLDRLHEGRELDLRFAGARRSIVPMARGKRVEMSGGPRKTSRE